MSLPSFYLTTTNRPLEALSDWRRGGALLLDPPYQRGVVWGRRRQQNLIKSILLGVPIPSIVINNRIRCDWADEGNEFAVSVIDGKQRITSILNFLDGHLLVPTWWFPESHIDPAHRADMSRYWDLSLLGRRKFHNRALAFSEGALTTLAEEQMVFELINFGGLAQGEVDTDVEA